MADLVSKIISDVQARMPDATAIRLIRLVNQVHRDILAGIPELRRDTVTLTLTAGQQEYPIGETLFQVDYATYLSAAMTGNPLNDTVVEELNEQKQTWRTDATGLPNEFYISSAQIGGVNVAVIGLVPAPNLTTIAGYPVLQLFGSVLQPADLATTDTIFSTLHSGQVYVEGVSFYAAAEIRPQLAGAYKAEYEYQMQLAKKYVRTRNEQTQMPPRQNIRGGGYQVPGGK